MSYLKMRQQERDAPLREFLKKTEKIHKRLNINTIKTMIFEILYF